MDIRAWNLDSLSVSDDEPTTGTGEERNVHSRHDDQSELQREVLRAFCLGPTVQLVVTIALTLDVHVMVAAMLHTPGSHCAKGHRILLLSIHRSVGRLPHMHPPLRRGDDDGGISQHCGTANMLLDCDGAAPGVCVIAVAVSTSSNSSVTTKSSAAQLCL